MYRNIANDTTQNNNFITIHGEFGNHNVGGLQHKGAVILDDTHYFIKMDELNPTVLGDWEYDNFNYYYSSVSESLSSIFIKNILNKPNFHSAIYEFCEVETKGRTLTATKSKNYLLDHEVEVVLSTGRTTGDTTMMSIDDFEERVFNAKTEKAFEELVHQMTTHGVPEKDAEEFLINQAVFDTIMGNKDRMRNPSNFVIAYNPETKKGRPINMDYGRTLMLTWTTMYEENYDVSEFLSEDLNDFAHEINSTNDSLLSALSNSQREEFLNKHHFEPFLIDKEALNEDINNFIETVQNSNAPFKKFAESKAKSFQLMMENVMKQPYVSNFTEVLDSLTEDITEEMTL